MPTVLPPRHNRPRPSRTVTVAVGLLVALYGIVGFPDVEEVVTNPW